MNKDIERYLQSILSAVKAIQEGNENGESIDLESIKEADALLDSVRFMMETDA